MVQVCLRISDEIASKLKKLSWQQSLVQNHRVTQGDLISMALSALERELSPVAPAEIAPVDDQDELTDDAPAELRI